MIRVRTGSRLHFGLFNPSEVPGVRRFGGVGLMIEDPGIVVSARPAREWSAEGPLASRALTFARRFAATLPEETPFHLRVERSAPEHVGLGTGTQLGLATARALASACSPTPLDAVELGRRVDRGLRSALGVHGFARGGFVVDGGHLFESPRRDIAPLIAHADFPASWRIVLVMSEEKSGLYGAAERGAFDRLAIAPSSMAAVEELCRLVLLGMMPALAERDLSAFGEAVFELNARVGEMFAAVQGGVYNGPGVTAVVKFLRDQGVRGVGQSSWGPTVFGIVEDQDRAEGLVRRLRQRLGSDIKQVIVTRARNEGAVVEEPRPPGCGPTPPDP